MTSETRYMVRYSKVDGKFEIVERNTGSVVGRYGDYVEAFRQMDWWNEAAA